MITGEDKAANLKIKNCSVIAAATQAALGHEDDYLAVHDAVQPFQLVDDDARQAEPSVYSAEQNDDAALMENYHGHNVEKANS